MRLHPREFKVTDWDAFRNLRNEDQEVYDCLDSLFIRLKEDARAVTKVVKTDLKVDRMDAHLAHLFRKRIAELNREIEAYSEELSKQ